MVAGRYTLLDQEAAPFLFKKCIDAQVGVLNVGVFNSGILATDDPGLQSAFEYAPADASLVARARAIAAACRRHGTSVPAASIHFARSHPAVAAIAIGASSGAELQTDAEFAQTPIPSALWDDLAAEGLIDERAAATVISRERA
jgi:D-threo-aldose 1-dehydrogenase